MAKTHSPSVSSGSSTPALAPALTLSPPLPSSPEAGKSTAQQGGKTSRNCKTTGIENNLSDLDVSGSFCMQKVAGAIEHVTKSIEVPEDGHPSTGSRAGLHVNRGSRRRRSSSRLDDPIHDIKNEKPPNDRFHNPTFQGAFREAKALMAGFCDTLGSNSLHYEPDSVMQRLHQQAAKLAHFECPSTRTVGFVGDSGVGKSSLLNSLLDKQGLARTSNSGSACTCVATEYHYHSASDYRVETNFFTREEILTQVRDLLQSYRDYHMRTFTSQEREEKEECKQKAKVASDTFRSMFGNRLKDLRILSSQSAEAALGHLNNLISQCQPDQASEEEKMSSLEQCSKVIARVTSVTSGQSATNEPAAWPYIRNIRVYSDAHILGKGLILVDLPGLHDSNTARRNIAERYMVNCDEIFAICNQGRAVTDAGVASVLELARKAKLSNVGIICTRSDDIKAEEAKRDWDGEKEAKISESLESQKDIRKTLSGIKDELQELESLEEDDDLSVEEQEEGKRLRRDRRNAEDELERQEFDLQDFLVRTRNEIVKRQLINTYRPQVPDGNLHVHCISNTIYWTHRNDPKSRAMPYLNLCGILEIREHCMALVSESRYSSALSYMKSDIPALLGDVQLWAQSGSSSMTVERKTKIRDAMNELERGLKRSMCSSTCELKQFAKVATEQFRATIYNFGISRIPVWHQGANEASADWNSWHHSSYAAFCRNRGCHSTATIGWRDWNEEMIHSMVNDLSPLWSSLESSLEKHKDKLRIATEVQIEQAVEHLDDKLQDEEVITDTVEQVLMSRQQLVARDFEVLFEKYQKDLELLRVDALSSIQTSLVGMEMKEPYRKASTECGSGSHARRQKIINSAVQRHSLFSDLMRQFWTKFGLSTVAFQDSLNLMAQLHMDAIRQSLDMVRNDNVILESEKDSEFLERVECGVRAARSGIRRLVDSLSA